MPIGYWSHLVAHRVGFAAAYSMLFCVAWSPSDWVGQLPLNVLHEQKKEIS